MKRCRVCKVEKELGEFNKDKSRKDGLQNKCKICQKQYKKQYYQRNKETMNQYQKQYFQRNKEAIKEYQKEYVQRNKEEIKAYRKQYVQRNKEEIKQYYKEYNKDYYRRNPEKQKARGILNSAVRRGKVHKPLYCSSCEGDKHLEAHHTDYSKPLEVLWLCKSCHVELHKRINKQPEEK